MKIASQQRLVNGQHVPLCSHPLRWSQGLVTQGGPQGHEGKTRGGGFSFSMEKMRVAEGRTWKMTRILEVGHCHHTVVISQN